MLLSSAHPQLPCPALPCPALPCPALPCPAWPCAVAGLVWAAPALRCAHRELEQAPLQGHHRGVSALGDDDGAGAHAAGLAEPGYLQQGRGSGAGRGGMRVGRKGARIEASAPRTMSEQCMPALCCIAGSEARPSTAQLCTPSQAGRQQSPRQPPTRSAISSTSSVSQPSLLAKARASFSAGGEGKQAGQEGIQQIRHVGPAPQRRTQQN